MECPYDDWLAEGLKCPLCGAEAQEFGSFEGGGRSAKKGRLKTPEIKQKIEEIKKERKKRIQKIIDLDMSEQEIIDAIILDLEEVRGYRSQIGGSIRDLFSIITSGSENERRMLWALLSLVHQNNIIIKQNELNRRLLQRLLKDSETH